MKQLIYTFLFLIFSVAVIYSQPQPPSNLTASESPWGQFMRVKLNWTNNSGQFVSFNIYKKLGELNDTTSFVKIVNHFHHTTFYDKFVEGGNTYSYYVTAVNQQGESDPSNMVEITLADTILKAVISGNITDESSNLPLGGVKVFIIPETGHFVPFIFTDSLGNFSREVNAGSYYIKSMKFGYYAEYYDNVPNFQAATKLILNGEDTVNLQIALAPIIPPVTYPLSGSVTDSVGNPLKSWITVYRLGNNTHHHGMKRTITDTLGNYSVILNEGDTVVVHARPFNHNYLPEFFDDKNTFNEADRIAVTGNITGINFILEPKPVYNNGISGTVTNPDNEPVNAFVSAFRKTTSLQMDCRRYTTETDSTGFYQFINMIPGEYILLTIPRGIYSPTYFRYDGTQTLNWHHADSVVVTDNGIVTGINFNVVPLNGNGLAEISGSVYDDKGDAVAGVTVYVMDENNQITDYSISDERGNYLLTGLIPGQYRVYSDMVNYNSTQYHQVSVTNIIGLNSNYNFTLIPDAATGVDNDENLIDNFELYQNYPNPFNPVTSIKYAISSPQYVTLRIYDILGNEIVTLVNEQKQAGVYSVNFNASALGGLASGIYFYKITAGSFTASKKLVLMK
ncbi:MAG: hypothetical protein A2V93_00095 [Ignavibacteria bacterium RBG_16_34_14]|nr:MAG: hypothetical protein A2V93_00095 [Ignavibacteria bacterium RBG_16_34_14]